MWTDTSLLKLSITALLILIVLAMLFAAIVTAFWPERVFKYSSLNWWRRAVLTVAAFSWFLLAGGGIAEAIGKLPSVAALRPEFDTEVSVYTLVLKVVRTIVVLLPWFLLLRLREAIDLRVRWRWVALIFTAPLVFCLPRSFAAIRGFDWSGIALFISFCMLIGLVEETVFRGYAFQLHSERRPKETIIVTSIIFAFAHLQKYMQDDGLIAWHFMANAFFCGIGLGVVRLATRSLGLCIVIHGVLDIFYMTGSPNKLALLALAIPATAALYSHPSCRRTVEPKAQVLCTANA